ncbi:hypothetical protein ONS95_002922 [Cadophora gregata]|uniref:uncharacterized protein n=1 Tax=Cadophora gregata TaxID=51156 RepID=UPI0026DAAEE2|nr:uncharacterized protein ONS95_002922 [Cadophora gregata]KAK0108101.1 hypothetical protein ONS95_002922 [Cadophora gregata]KAK0109310.1 hypothetical protein ONS96_003129 [Cadophora gregata f. sp. sojae]
MSQNLPKAEYSSQTSSNGDDCRHEIAAQSYISSANSTPPPTFSDLDRWRYHIDFQKFSSDLQAAANAVFPNDTKSRYTKVSVLMLSWENEDPNLPVSQEIDKLYNVFRNLYQYETDRWTIPDDNCHYKLTEKIMDYVKPAEDSKTHLKIVYYAGHARLTETRLLVWTSVRNYTKPKCPIVKWGGIQTILEEAPNDVLILLDCCASGTANASEGNGVNELISACAFNETANGVGPFSFTSALVTELRLLGNRPSFSVGELYKKIFFRTQCRMPEELYADGTERERHPAPIHLVLTQGGPVPRSIQLPAKVGPQRQVLTTSSWQPPLSWGYNGSNFGSFDSGTSVSANSRHSSVSGPSINQDSVSTMGTSVTTDPIQGISEALKHQRGPRLLFAVRMRDTFQPGEDMVELFAEWMRCIPTIADEVNVEASFDSYSTIVIISLPVSVAAYLPQDPSIISLGPITSENRVLLPEKHQVLRSAIPYSIHQRNNSEPGPRRKSNTIEHPGNFIGDFVPSAQSSLSAILDLLPKIKTSDLQIILDSVETIKRSSGIYNSKSEPEPININEVRGGPRFTKLGIGYRSTKNIPRSIPKTPTSISQRSRKLEEEADFDTITPSPAWDSSLRSTSGTCYSIGENRDSFQSMSSLGSFETDSSLKSQRSSTSTIATRFSHLSDFNPQNTVRHSAASHRLIEETCPPSPGSQGVDLPNNTIHCTAPHCSYTFSDDASRERHEQTAHEYKGNFTCLLDACTSACSFPCFQICHFKPFQTQRWDLLKAHLQKEHLDVKFTLETLPDSWTGNYEHTGSGWNCGDCGRFLGSWKDNPSAINRHFENCPVRIERLKEKLKSRNEGKSEGGFSINR